MKAMILAGGTGSRLWPLSRQTLPKQFLNLHQEDFSLLQETYRRIRPLVEAQNIFLLGALQNDLILERQMRKANDGFPLANIFLEPMPKNTAPAILWGLCQIPEAERDDAVVIMPSDHLIKKGEVFREKLAEGEKLAKEGWIVIFGIEPTGPETGYGYIKSGAAMKHAHKVERFVEKPDRAKAEAYLTEGGYSWNAGIFMGSANTMLSELQTHCPEMYAAFFKEGTLNEDVKTKEGIKAVFESIKGTSFDYAVLEKSDKVAVITMDVGWDDLGSWDSIHHVRSKDQNGNVSQGDVILQDTKDSLIFSHRKLVACIGMERVIVVDSEDALLVCNLDRAQDVKKMVAHLKEAGRREFMSPRKVFRPWGSFEELHVGPNYKIKELTVLPGQRISLQRHFSRSEHWVVVSGTALVTKGDESVYLQENESTFIPKTSVHRLANPGKIPLNVVEVQLGEYLEEDDIERVEDDFGRN